MEFLKGNNTFDFGKLKLGSVNIDRIYLGTSYVWPPLVYSSCAIEGSAAVVTQLFSCAIEGSAQGSVPLFSCAIEGSATPAT